MRVAVLSGVVVVASVVAVLGSGCGGSSGTCTTGCGGVGGAAGSAGTSGGAGAAGAGAAGAGGHAGVAGGSAGAAGNQVGGAAGGGGNGGGSAGAGGAGGAAVCGEPASCEGYDDNPDAHLTAAITCLWPSTVAANADFTLAVFGHHLAIGPTDPAIVTVGGAALNGVPASACHLEVAVPASAVAAGQLPVVVSPGGRIQASAPATLTIQ